MSVPTVKDISNYNRVRPSDDIDPKNKKENEYSLLWSQFIYGQWFTDNTAITQSQYAKFKENESYACGEQDTSKYQSWILGAVKDKGPKTPMYDTGVESVINDLIGQDVALDNLNFDKVFSPLPKYVENIIGIMKSQNHDIVINAVDENSGAEREKLKATAWVKSKLNHIIKSFEVSMGIPNPDEMDIVPDSPEELELFANIGAFKLGYEIAMEKLISHTFDNCDFDDFIQEQIIASFVINNMASVVVLNDIQSGKLKVEYKELDEVILEKSKKPDHSDSSWGGFIEYYTIAQIRQATGLKEDKIFELAESTKGQFGNPAEISRDAKNNAYGYDGFRLPVLNSFWKTIDTEYSTTRQTSNGPVTFPEPYRRNNKPPKMVNNDRRKTNKTPIHKLYQCRWIIDTEYTFDRGPVENAPFNYGTSDVEFPIRLYKLRGKSKIETVESLADQIYLTYIKMQNGIAKAPPPGLAIEVSALENVSWGNKKMQPQDHIRIYTASGHILYRLRAKGILGQTKDGSQVRPIEELRGGLGTVITDSIQALEYFYKEIDVLTGIDGISSANIQPSRDTGKAVTEMAVAATSNTLKPIYSGLLNLKKNSAKVITWEGQALCDAYDIEDNPYYSALGSSNIIAIKSALKFPPVEYGLTVEPRVSEREKAEILSAAKAGLAGGKNGIPAITLSEYSFIMRYLNSGRSIKYIELWLAKKEREAEELSQKRAQENLMLQAQNNERLKKEETNGQIQVINAKRDADIAIEKAKGEEDRKTLAVKFKYEKVSNSNNNSTNN